MTVLTSLLIVLATLAVTVFLWPRLAGFLAQKPSDYAPNGPAMDIRSCLSGPMVCEGVIFGPFGRVTSRFVADIDGQWDGNRGHLREVFRYDSGAVQHREWHLTLGNDGRIKATAPDVVGQGEGHQQGSAVVLNYTIKLTEDAGGHALDVTDWMYLTENGSIVNRSQFRKFGIKVAELVATMRPAPQVMQAAE